MSLDSVRAWLAANAPELRLIEVEESTATVETAAKALGVEPGRIAKTLAVRAGDHLFCCARGATRGSTTASARTSSAPGRGCLGQRRRLSSPVIR